MSELEEKMHEYELLAIKDDVRRYLALREEFNDMSVSNEYKQPEPIEAFSKGGKSYCLIPPYMKMYVYPFEIELERRGWDGVVM